MGGLFVASVYAGYLGWQWRRTRTIGDDIKGLKAQLPKPAAEGEAAPASPLTAQIADLEKVSRAEAYRTRKLQRQCSKCSTRNSRWPPATVAEHACASVFCFSLLAGSSDICTRKKLVSAAQSREQSWRRAATRCRILVKA
jgi:hypothetical protein